MRKIKILALLSIVALLLAVPAMASAQVKFPAAIAGTAMIDDEMAADETMITAMVGGEKVGSAMVMDGKFAILVAPATASENAGMVEFMIGDEDATSSMEVMLEPGIEAMGVMLSVMSAPPGAVVHASLYEVWPSGQTGMVTLTEMGEQTNVELSLNPGAMMGDMAGVYMGSCNAMGDLAHSLGEVNMRNEAGGMVDIAIATLQDGNHVVAAMMGDMATVCGQIPDADGMAAMPALPQGPQGEKGEDGDDGADGNDGARGPQGIPGAKGADGSRRQRRRSRSSRSRRFQGR